MLAKKEVKICAAIGGILANSCIEGSDNEKLNNALVDLRPGVDVRFKRELIYFRIFITYFQFETELLKERFAFFIRGFQIYLLENWDRQLFDNIQDKLKEFDSKFVVFEDNYLKLKVTDSIVDELLINSGFGVSDLFLFDSTKLKDFFRKDCIAHKKIIDRYIYLLTKNLSELESMLRMMNLDIDDFVKFDDEEPNTTKEPQKEAVSLQLTLDKEIEIGRVQLNDTEESKDDTYNYQIYVSLVEYQNRRYVSISRMHYRKLKRTGEIKKTFRNAIWIPPSRLHQVINILKLADVEADRRNWWGHYINEDLKVSAEILEEGESKQRLFSNVRETARAFLISAANYLEDKLTLKVNVKNIAEQLNLSLPLILRVVDYLEDSGYIKQVERFTDDSNSKEKLFEYLPKMLELLPNEDIKTLSFEKAKNTSGLSSEDIDALDYLDDEDPKIARWAFALRFAETEIINKLLAGQIPISFKITAAGYNWLE